MPVYDFLCTKCGKEFTLVLSVQGYEQRNVACPHCKSKEVERTLTAVQVITSKKS